MTKKILKNLSLIIGMYGFLCFIFYATSSGNLFVSFILPIFMIMLIYGLWNLEL